MEFIDLPYDTRYHILSFLSSSDVFSYLKTSTEVCDECVAHDYPFHFQVNMALLKSIPMNARRLFTNISDFRTDIVPGIAIERLAKIHCYETLGDCFRDMVSLRELSCDIVGEIQLPTSIEDLNTGGEELAITNANKLTKLRKIRFYRSVPPCISELPSLTELSCHAMAKYVRCIVSMSITCLYIEFEDTHRHDQKPHIVLLSGMPNLVSTTIIARGNAPRPDICIDEIPARVKIFKARDVTIIGIFPRGMDEVDIGGCIVKVPQVIDSKSVSSETDVRFTDRVETINVKNLGRDLTKYANLKTVTTTEVYPKTHSCEEIHVSITNDAPVHVDIENHTKIVGIRCWSNPGYVPTSISFTHNLVSLKLWGVKLKETRFPDSIRSLSIYNSIVWETLDFVGTKFVGLVMWQVCNLTLIKNLPDTIKTLSITGVPPGSLEIENIPRSLKEFDVSVKVIFPDLPDNVLLRYHN